MREVGALLVSLSIVGTTLWMTVNLYKERVGPPQWHQPPDSSSTERVDPFALGLEILGLLLPLAGAVVGYYTGRVAASQALDHANLPARQAGKRADSAERKTTRVIREASLTVHQLRTAAAGGHSVDDVATEAEVRLGELATETEKSDADS